MFESPILKPKQNVTLRVPIVNKGGVLKNVTISPVISNSLDEFPFIAENVNYGRYFERWESGGMAYVEYNFTVSYYATNGNKPVKFLATYYENGEPQQCAFSTYVYITNGYVAPIEKAETAMSVMVSGYKLFVNGAEVSGLMAALPAMESLFSYVRFTPTVDAPTSASLFTETLNSTSAVSPGLIALTYAASLLPTVSVSPFELASDSVATFWAAARRST